MRASAALLALAAGIAAAAAGCGGPHTKAFRIGILSDCYGPFSSAHELIVASAELPLLARGGRLRGKNPSDGVAGARAAGRPVQLLVGCAAGLEDVIPEARRLVEENGADALVGTLYPQEGLVLRAYARRRPGTAFLIQPSGAPELTLTQPALNVFRFSPDSAQSVAGIGTYAYRNLGWRTAVTIGDDTPYGWESVAGFVAEFCSLGGRVVDRRWVPFGTDTARVAARLPAAPDGVYASVVLTPMLGFLKRYAAAHHDLSKRLVASDALFLDPRAAALASNVVVAGSLSLQPTHREGAYVASFAKAFPGIPAASALAPLAFPYRDGVEAALEALEQSRGDGFLAALARVELDSPRGRIHLDRNRQAVGPAYLSQAKVGPGHKPAFRTLRVVQDVDQTFGGYFRPGGPPATRTQPACVRRPPPRWAR
jgi:branched-chain amino acid transport system substrate-binding protein